MEATIKLTRIRDNEDAIAKKISWDGNKLQKEAKASVKDGVIESAEYASWESFKDYLSGMLSDECLVLGKLKHGISGILVGSKDKQDVSNGVYNRSLDNFEWHEDYQLCCIDFDGSGAGNLTPDELIAKIDEVMPGFAQITKVVKHSSSAWIYDENDKPLTTINGFHIYFMVNHPELIAQMFQGTSSSPAWLHVKLWLNGHGYIKNSKPRDVRTTAISQMKRTVYDSTVFSPERIIFEAEPILQPGLHKEYQEAFIIEGTSDYLDLRQYEDLSEHERKEYLSVVGQAKKLNDEEPYMIECKRVFCDHVRERVEQGEYENRTEYKGMSTDEIIEQEYNASSNAILMQDHEIELASGHSITVEAIMNDPKKYHGQSCKDPHEPEYGSSSIGIIYTVQDVPIIFSHAHGGIRYRFCVSTETNDEPDFHSREYWLEHFYMVAYEKKDEIYHIHGNKIEKYSHAGFNHKFAGYRTDVGEEDNPKLVAMTKWWMNNIDKKCIAGDGFSPDQPILYHKHGALVINEYVPEILHYGFDTPDQEESEQSASPWLNHIRMMIHNGDEAEILIDWFAYLIQHPNERPMFAPLVLSETRGVGKDMATDIFSSLIGHKFAKKSSISDLSKADWWGDVFYHTKLITVSECGSSDDRYTVGNNIKDNITCVTKSMNRKGKEIHFGNVYAGIIFFSNSKSPFRLDEGDRRFFVTRCDWSKLEADKIKADGYFSKLSDYYTDPVHLHGLYHYLLNREIKTAMKGDAPMTSTKEVVMDSDANEIEQFFIDLRKHPCKYWTSSMIKLLYVQEAGGGTGDDSVTNKQFNHLMWTEMVSIPRTIKVKGDSVRLKTFSIMDAELDNKDIRENIEANWDITTSSLHPSESTFANDVWEDVFDEEHEGNSDDKDKLIEVALDAVA